MQLPQTQYAFLQPGIPLQASSDASYRIGYIWINLLAGLLLIFTFDYFGTQAATPIAVSWLLFLIVTLKEKFPAAVTLLFLAACYERPILDFGFGIRGTIKLFDIVAIAVIVAGWWRPYSKKKKPVHDTLYMCFCLLTIIAIFSAIVIVALYIGVRRDLAIRSVYYAGKMIEYVLVLHSLRLTTYRKSDISRALNFLLLGLTAVASIGVLQGLGILRNYYYSSYAGGESFINTSWALSVLGPNHIHLGVYSVLAIFLSIILMQIRFRIILFVPMILGLGSLFYSHSATSIAMIAFLIGANFIYSSFSSKLLVTGAGFVIGISIALYFTGVLGNKEEGAELTTQKLSLEGELGIIHRAFIRPPALISEAISLKPAGMFFGFGFRSPRATLPMLPNMGDSNYMAVFIDVGIVGFVAYIAFLVAFYKKLASALKLASADHFMSIYTRSAILFFWSVLLVMFGQEILWPIHSRGNTFPIFLIFMALPFVYYESQRDAYPYRAIV